VRTRAPESTNIAAIVIGAGFENTDMTRSIGAKPKSMKAAAPPKAVTSGG
jgi:hypothetical protein